MVPYAGPHLGGEVPLVKYVLGAGVAMVLGLSQCQREDFTRLRLMIAVYTLLTRLSVLSPQYGGNTARTIAGSDVGRWPWMVHARCTVVVAACSMCWGLR